VSGVTYFNGAGRFDRYLDIPDKNRTFRFRPDPDLRQTSAFIDTSPGQFEN
jgi:hypothetical protein